MAASRLRFRDQRRAPSFSRIDLSKDDDVIDFVGHRWETRAQRRQVYERQWYINIAQYLGLQYHTWSSERGRMFLPEAPPWRVRLVANRLLPIARKIVAKALRQKPIWTGIPATSDQEDVLSARVGTKLLQHYWKTLMLDELLVETFTWMATTGNVFLRVFWDSSRGPSMRIGPQDVAGEIAVTPEEEPGVFARGLERMGELLGRKPRNGKADISQPLGDIGLEVCTPFEVDPDPSATRMHDATHLIHTKARSLEYLEDRYPKAKDLTPDASSDDALSRYYERKIAALSPPSSMGFGTPTKTDEEEDQVLEHALYVKPTRKYPRGLLVVVAGGKVLRRTELEVQSPLQEPEIPFAHIQEVKVPGRFWGTCVLEQSIPLQAAYNRQRSALIENSNVMSRPKWLNPKGSGIQQNALTSEPGEVIDYRFPLKPEQVNIQEIPNYVLRLLEMAVSDIEQVSAQHEVSNAQVPGGVRAGIAIAQLQEQDDTMLAPAFLSASGALERCGSWMLQLLAQNVKRDRIIRIVGENEEIDVLHFTGESLIGPNKGKPGVNYFDVKVHMGSQLPMSAAQRTQLMLDLTQYGVLAPQQNPDDRKLILQTLEIGTEEPGFAPERLDRSAARRENLDMINGTEVALNPWDNDEIHFEEHRNFQKRPEFRRLVASDPFLLQLFEAHVQEHLGRLQVALGATEEQGAIQEELAPEEGALPLEGIPAAPAPPEPDPLESLAALLSQSEVV